MLPKDALRDGIAAPQANEGREPVSLNNIAHFVVLMLENRSFDSMLGSFTRLLRISTD
jgi:phospholipase C